MSNPIQQAMDTLRAARGGEQVAVAIRNNGDEYSVKVYRNGTPISDTAIGGKRELNEALASLS